jgi:hypothetical protein
VEITRRGATPDETAVVYRGRATVARASGLVPGRTYSFDITTFDQFGATTGTPVTVTTVQSSLTLSGAGSAVPGGTVALSGTLSWNGAPSAGRPVSIQSLPVGTSVWRAVASVTTTGSGTFSASVHPAVTTRYRAAYIGAAARGGCYSSVTTVTVAQPARQLTAGHRWIRSR